MAKTNVFQLMREVRQEAAKVTWPSRKETTVSTIMVFVMVVLASAFFFLIDQLLSIGVRLFLGFGN